MAFLGNDRTTLDSKRRLVVAAKYRRCLKPEAKESFVVTRGLDGCIHAYPLDEWDAVIAPRVAAIPEGTPEGRALRRRFLFHATEVQLDKQGRLLLPQPLADEAQVTCVQLEPFALPPRFFCLVKAAGRDGPAVDQRMDD